MEITTRAPLRTGRRMPIMGLGTWELTDDTAGTVEEALRLGYRMVDTAVDYGSQAGVGEALNRSDLPRDQIFLVAKVEEDEDAYDATRRYLAEMDQERADLMLIHRPPEDGVGEALWRGLMRARDDGLTTDIGVSNYSVEQLEALIDATGEVPVVNQVEWTPFGWKPAMLDYCREREIVVQAWSPLTRGERLDDERLAAIADEHEATPAQVLLRWSLQRGSVPLPKANRLDHLLENLGAFDIRLAEEDMEELDRLNEEWSALGETVQY